MRKFSKATAVSCACLASTALWSLPASAQNAPGAGPTPLPASGNAPAAQQAAPGNTAVPASDAKSGIADIVITATRRETSLQHTPQAISVVTGADLLGQGRQGLEDLKVSVPNINIATTSNTTQLYIRGIGNTFISAGGDPGVALYQDGAYISDQTTSNVNFFDVARIEVLRGPQGALYGRNATGGAINIISAAPTDVLSGSLSATTGNYGRIDTEGYVSGPLGIADTDVRLSFQTQHHDGYAKNLLSSSNIVPDSLDDLDSQAFRVQTRTRLPGGGVFRIIATHYRESDNGPALEVVPVPGEIYPTQLLYGVAPSGDPRHIYANEGTNRIRLTNVNASLDQPLFDGTLSATGNYRKSSRYFINDCDGTSADNCKFEQNTHSKDYYADVHFASAANGRLRWILGGTYLAFNQYQLSAIPMNTTSAYFGGDPTVPFNLDAVVGGTVRTKSYAFYTDLRFKLNDVWSLTGQARYSKTTKNALETLIIPSFGLNITGFPNHLRDSGVPFKIGVEGQLTNDVLVYANYSTAFKDGAINLGALQTRPVLKEEVRSEEVGFKSSLLDHKLQLNAAAFYSNYKNLQISQLVGQNIALVNVPKAQIYGAEAEIVAEPLQGLRLTTSLGYLHPTLKEFTNAPTLPGGFGPAMNLAGNQLPYDAKWNVTARADYKFNPVAGYTAQLGGAYAYQSRIFFNEFNFLSDSQKAVGRFDVNTSFGPSKTSWKLFGYVRNLTNRTVQTGATIYSPLLGAMKGVSYAPPRTYGVGLSYSF